MLETISGYAQDAWSWTSAAAVKSYDAVASHLPLIGAGALVIGSTGAVAKFGYDYYKATQQVKAATKTEDQAAAKAVQEKAWKNFTRVGVPAGVVAVATVATYQFGNDVAAWFKPVQTV